MYAYLTENIVLTGRNTENDTVTGFKRKAEYFDEIDHNCV